MKKGQKRIKVSIGICAYNEEKNISHLLDFLLKEQTKSVLVDEILVVCSGCIDKTTTIVKSFQRKNKRVKLVIEAERRGKASAVNLMIQKAVNQIIVLESADTIPAPGAVEKLVSPLRLPEVGLVTARPVSFSQDKGFIGFAVDLLWKLHHHVSLKHPKAGEMVAFKKIFNQIHPKTPVDEAIVECLIAIQGYEIRYEPKAIVYNKGPETLRDFLRQRRRIYAGHLEAKKYYGHRVSTLSGFSILPHLFKVTEPSLIFFLYTPAVIFMELVGRTTGWFDFHFKTRDHSIWKISESTKTLK